MAVELEFRSVSELREDFAARRASPVDLMERILDRIDKFDGRLKAFYTVNEAALQAAREADKAIRNNQAQGPLHGIPFSVKDLIVTAGMRTTRGSAIFEHFVPDFSAPAVERAQNAGAILLGKTSTSEFGWKAVTDNPLFGATLNPWNPGFTPGGSSGGAASAVASGMGPLALATDAAGSTRVPASFCGVFGMKPSFGRIPIFPAPSADSLVHAGVIARTVRDAALFLSVITGPDERDRNTLPDPADAKFWDAAPGLKGMRAAWCPGFAGLLVDAAVMEQCAAAVKQYQQAGLLVDEVKPDLPDITAAFNTLFQGLFGAQLVDALSTWRERMDPGLVEMVEAGRNLTAYDLTKAGMARSAYWDVLRKTFQTHDFLLTPVVGTLPFPLGRDASGEIAGAPSRFPQWLGFLYPFNLSGQPAASIPCGWTQSGLPVGLQIVGRRFQDSAVLRVAAAFEQIRPWAHRIPPLSF